MPSIQKLHFGTETRVTQSNAHMLPHTKMHHYISLKKDLRGLTFIPIIWTQSTAVPVALERNSARASSAIARRLRHQIKRSSQTEIVMFGINWFKETNYIPSWVVSIPLGMLGRWVLLLLGLTTHDHRLTAVVCGRSRCLVRIHQMMLSKNHLVIIFEFSHKEHICKRQKWKPRESEEETKLLLHKSCTSN